MGRPRNVESHPMHLRLIALLLAAAAAAPVAQAEELLVPAYFYPVASRKANWWGSLAATAPKAAITAILNPASGPGASVDPNYVTAISHLQTAGGKVIGYVSSSYANRSLSDVVADINKYVAFYPVQGFFIDEMTNDTDIAHVQFYQSVYNYIKGLDPQYVVVGNPGTSTAEIYASLPVADKLVVFEGSAASYASYVPSAWQAPYGAARFAHIVYGASKSQMAKMMSGAAARGASNLFVTSDKLVNPYDTLPSYWSDEVNRAAAN
jgi:hypothetical protein